MCEYLCWCKSDCCDDGFCSLPARTSIIAAANPAAGHYNKAKTVSENLRWVGWLCCGCLWGMLFVYAVYADFCTSVVFNWVVFSVNLDIASLLFPYTCTNRNVLFLFIAQLTLCSAVWTLYLESLEHRHLVTDLTLVYHILHGHYDSQLDATFCIIDNSRTRGHAYKLLKPHCTIDTTKYFFLTVLLVPGTTCQTWWTWWSILPHCPPSNATFPFLTSHVIHSSISQY